MTEAETRFAEKLMRGKRLFLGLSLAGVGVAALLSAYYGYCRLNDPAFPLGLRAVIVILVLLNARQNLRQYRFAGLLESLQKPLSS